MIERDVADQINNVQGDRKVFGLSSYQTAATEFAKYPGKGRFLGVQYTTLKLNGEAGEIAEKIGKIMRDDHPLAEQLEGASEMVISRERRADLLLELGDVLWYVAALAKELDYDLAEVANANLDKLRSRQRRGTLQGSGDYR